LGRLNIPANLFHARHRHEFVFVDHVFSFGNPVFGRLTRYASAFYDHFVIGRLYETGGAAFRLCHFVGRH
jgi:hypothetical protein